ncbi:hypothetical protein [Pseudomonas oryzihabitans]|uniref:hypothetical protein n=1 Tax=Pseudomonas oryzihabitans TaxID=47885 RepID=UPI0028A97412|nr:hypothetical protein [Pseudomonas oryzihabitans]
MIESSQFYRKVREFAATRKDWQEAIRYDTQPDERWDATLVSQRVYGTRDEYLAVIAAAGIDHPFQELTQRRLVLPTPAQLLAFKQMTSFASTSARSVR